MARVVSSRRTASDQLLLTLRSIRRPAAAVLSPLASVCLLAANVDCGTPSGGDFLGATSGGSQDIAEARSVIESGGVPDPDGFTVEGFLSEHDIPMAPPENAGEFYAASAVAWRVPFDSAAPVADVLIGLGTTIELDSFERLPLNLAVVIDRSGSMKQAASAGDYRSKFDAVRQAMRGLLAQLDGGELLTVVTFNNEAHVALDATVPTDADSILRMLDDLEPDGATNIMAALQLAFERVAAAAGDARDNRVILFTDAQPNVGCTGSSEFLPVLRRYASLGIGFTLMGVG